MTPGAGSGAGELHRYDLEEVPTAMMSNVPYKEMVQDKDGDWCKYDQAIAIISALESLLSKEREARERAEADADRLAAWLYNHTFGEGSENLLGLHREAVAQRPAAAGKGE
jgi:hypothetical protein